jgi:hypothetical protein
MLGTKLSTPGPSLGDRYECGTDVELGPALVEALDRRCWRHSLSGGELSAFTLAASKWARDSGGLESGTRGR